MSNVSIDSVLDPEALDDVTIQRAVPNLQKSAIASDVLRSGAVVLVAQNIVNLLNFIFHFVVSRRVGVVAYGSLNALIAGFMVFMTPATILTTIVVKYASEFYVTSDCGRLRTLAKRCLLALTVFALAVVAVGSAFSSGISAYLHVGDAIPIVLMIGILGANLVLPARGILQGVNAFGSYSFSITSEAFVKVALAVVFTGMGFGITGALAGWLLGAIFSAAYTYLVLWYRNRSVLPSRLRLDYRRLLKTSGYVTAAMLLVASLGFSDVIVVKHFFDARSAGLYSAAALCGKMIFMLVSFIPAVVLPKAANLAHDRRAAGIVLVQGLFASTVLVAGALLVYFFLPAHVIGALAGRAFLAAAPYVFPYGIASALLSVLNTVVYFRIGAHEFRFLPALTVIATLQLAAMLVFHPSLPAIIGILIVCDASALVCALWGTQLSSFRQKAAFG